jgi:hypothetical protein
MLAEAYGVRLWSEADTMDSWEPLYCGDVEELLDRVGVITLTLESGDGFVAWGGGPEDYFEAVQKLPPILWDRELATLYNENTLVWESVQAFHDACVGTDLNGMDNLCEAIIEELLEQKGGKCE